ncbi:MAG: GumC family protein [Hyphomicrobiales bacterium]
MSQKTNNAALDEPALDIYAIIRAIVRACVWAVPIAALVAAGTWYKVSTQDPVYLASATVLIDVPEISNLRGASDVSGPDASLRLSQEAINSKVQIIRSRDLSRAVVKRMGLADVPELQPEPKKNIFGQVTEEVDPDRYLDGVLANFDDKLVVYPVDTSRVIVVDFESSDPTLAAAVANGVVEEFLIIEQNAKQESTQEARAWLEAEISLLRQRVVDAESSAEQFRSRMGLFATASDTTLPQQQLASLSQTLSDARARESVSKSAFDGFKRLFDRAGGNVDLLLSSPAIANSSLIQSLRQARGQLEAQIADLSADLLPRHPRLRALVVQRQELDRQIATEARAVLSALEQDASRTSEEVEQLQQLLSAQKLETGNAQQNEVELRAFEREARAERELLETLLAQYRTLLAREGAGGLPAEARFIARADAPLEPSGPRVAILVIAAGLASLLLCLGFVVLRELLSGRALGIKEEQQLVEDTSEDAVPDLEARIRRRLEDEKLASQPLAA